MAAITIPGSSVCQVSGFNPQGQFILSVLAKRTYSFDDRGNIKLADEQLPLFCQPLFGDDIQSLWLEDLDIYPFKLRTDVVLSGHAYSYQPSRCFTVALAIGSTLKQIAVFGSRHCARTTSGRLYFSEPEPIEKVELSYTKAYGGRDAIAEAAHGSSIDVLRPYLPGDINLKDASPYIYPRNRHGVGYLINCTPQGLEQTVLPNLEDPDDLLTPDRLAIGTVSHWPAAPLPCATTWMSPVNFPRLGFFGILPAHEPQPEAFTEIRRGFVPSYIMKLAAMAQPFDFRFANGASLGLQVEYLRGGEVLMLSGLDPRCRQLRLSIPRDNPRLWVDGREGNLLAVDPVMHTLRIEPDFHRLSIVWRGAGLARRPYSDSELQHMPLRVEWTS